MSKEKTNIVYISGQIGKTTYLKRWTNFTLDKDFSPNMNKVAIYVRQHHHAFKVESPQGTLYLWVSKKFDTDREKAKSLLESVAQENGIKGEIREIRQVTSLLPQEYAMLQNPDSLAELSKPITFANNETLTTYAQGILMILGKLRRMKLVNTPNERNDLKVLHKLLNSVVEKL